MKETDIMMIVEHVKNLIEKYANDENTQREFCEKVEEVYFSGKEFDDDYYCGADAESLASWRQKMPELSADDVEVVCEYEDGGLAINVTGIKGLGMVGQAFNMLYTVVTDKIIAELYNIPEIIDLNPSSITHGDGDEGCIYIHFNEKFWL